MPPRGPRRQYNPPQYLLVHCTAAQISSLFEEFCESLRYVQSAPEVVFERLVGSLNNVLMKTSRQDQTTIQELRREKTALESSVEQIQLQLAELSERVSIQEGRVNAQESSTAMIKDLAIKDARARLVFQFSPSKKAVDVKCGTALTPGGCTWADIGIPDSDLQFGEQKFERNAINSWMIVFGRPFPTVPKVVVWLTEVDYHGRLSIRVSAASLSQTGFQLQIDSSWNSDIHLVGVAWVAYPKTRYDIFRGEFSTQRNEDSKCLQLMESGSQPVQLVFLGGSLMVAITSLDVEENREFALDLKSGTFMREPGDNYFSWSLSVSGKDSCLYSVRGMYLITGGM